MNVVVIAVYIDFNTSHDQKLSVHNYLKIFDDDFEIVAKSGLTNPDEISGMMAGPFASQIEAEIFIDNINSYSLQF